jgi:hypothetical protein
VPQLLDIEVGDANPGCLASRFQAASVEHSCSSAAETGIAFIKQLRKEVAIAAVVEDQFALG